MKKVLRVHRTSRGHWVGDGFPVRTLFSYAEPDPGVSPFLLFDYAGPATFPPSPKPRGVEEHPHRGFETVTIVYQGELVHRDSAGNSGRIGPGDVQWMTAASGVVHEEMHAPEFSQRGGDFEVVQLWVNLPARDKKAAPGYQTLLASAIPTVALPDGGALRVIAGEFGGARGPASTFTPVHVWDVTLPESSRAELPVPSGLNAVLVVLRGRVVVEGHDEEIGDATVAVLGREGDRLALTARADTKLLLLLGEPIEEPMVGYGPFVMNTHEEIRQAIHDYQSGRMGHLTAAAR